MLLCHPVLNAPYKMTTALAFEKFMRVHFSKVSFTSCHFGAECLKYNDYSAGFWESERVHILKFQLYLLLFCCWTDDVKGL